MIQEQIYAKDINRNINGVIKADSKAELAIEINEYVITAEQQRPQLLPALFNTLTPPNKPTCVWISGDFGSGKSHLLKILSYVLENQLEINDRKCAEIFADKAGEDFELKKSIRLACSIPTESVLFNIQEKLDGIGNNQIDPVLNIFLKEFNRKLGFDDKKPAIAEIERYFYRKGKYDWFVSEYESRYGKSWIADRPSALLKKQNIAKLFAELEGISEADAMSNISSSISNYTMDIDGFVSLVKEHLESKPTGSRFIFFVDEVGQFVGKDVHRMLSLQTIAEGLTDKTDGRATIFVTSQMDINATLGSLERQQQHDFSRIQGRFTTRINLTSANADEVIQRRLLDKKPEPQQYLCEVYSKQKNIIKSLFSFGDNSQFKSSYRSEDQFAIDFPFIDYQFDLLQNSIIELSKNNAFSGTQQSVGERSMLTITQEVAKAYQNYDLDHIVQFCDMYEGIRGILQTKIQSDILQAERTLNDEIALKVLKTLFLVKYVNGFHPTTDNITKILLPSLDTDFPKFKSSIQEALNKLVRTSYIEKADNDEYHFQTNEEKDIEMEIKNEELQPDTINAELKRIFRDVVFTETKVKLSAFKIFTFGRIVDEQIDGRESDIYIHFITPLGDIPTNDESVKMYSMGHSEQLLVVLGEDKYLTEDIAMFKKADKCLTRLLSADAGSYRQQIVSDKRRVNSKRRESIIERITNLTKDARLFIAGQEITDIRTSVTKERLNEGMARLVEQVYTNLKMLSIDYDDSMLKHTIAETNSFGFEMDNCSTEILNWINRNKLQSIRTKVKDLVDYFHATPYGWYETASLCILAKLYLMEKISFISNGSPVANRELYFNLTNSTAQASLLIEIEETISVSQINKLKSLYREFFDDENCAAQSAKDVHQQFSQRLEKLIGDLNGIQNKYRYQFVQPLNDIIPVFQRIASVFYPSLYAKSSEIEDAIDKKIDEVDPICDFISGSSFAIFTRIENIMNGNQANLFYVSQDLRKKLEEIFVSKTPWKYMTEAKEIIDTINQEIATRQEKERQTIIATIDTKYGILSSLPSFNELQDSQKAQVTVAFDALREEVMNERFIGNLIAMNGPGGSINRAYDSGVESINGWLREAAENEYDEDKEKDKDRQKPKSSIKNYIRKSSAMDIHFTKDVLESHEDVEEYIETLRTRLLKFIDEETTIMLD